MWIKTLTILIAFVGVFLPYTTNAQIIPSYTQLSHSSGNGGNIFTGHIDCGSSKPIHLLRLFLFNETAAVKTLTYTLGSSSGTIETPSTTGRFAADLYTNTDVICSGQVPWSITASTTTNPVSFGYPLQSHYTQIIPSLYNNDKVILTSYRFTTTNNTGLERLIASALFLDNSVTISNNSSSSMSATTTIITQNDNLLTFSLLYFIFLITIFFVIFITYPLFKKNDRK